MNKKRRKKDSPITVRSFSSLGESGRIRSRFTSELLQTLSKNERNFYLMASASPNVVNIEIQVNIDFEESKKISQELKITHPNYKHEKENILSQMSTDFLITFQNLRQIAVSAKYQSDLKIRNIAKMDIEKVYWNNKGVDFYLFTEKDIDPLRLRNANYLNDNYRDDIETYIPDFLTEFKKKIKVMDSEIPIHKVAKSIANKINVQFEIIIQCIKFSILQNLISVEKNIKLDHNTPIKHYQI